MFDHLDDPNPPQPSALLVDRIAAEGAHRLRRHRIVASGAIVAAATLAVAGIAAAGRLPGQDGSDIGTIGPSGSDTTTSEAPTTTTTPGSTTTTTTAQPGISTPTAPDDGVGDDTFAAIVKHPTEDTFQVVLADATTGDVEQVLAEFPMLNRQVSGSVAWSPQEQAVYYVVPAGDYGSGGLLPDTIWRVAVDDTTPDQIVPGTSVSLSPDGTKLAYATSYEGDRPGALVVLYLDGGGERSFALPSVDHMVYDTDFIDEDTVVFAQGGLEEGSRVAALSLLGDGDQLSDAEVLGPTAAAPPGTTWSSPDRRVADGLLGVVENCCELDANSYEGGTSYLVVDPAGGAELDRVALPDYPLEAEAGPEGTEQLFLLPPPDSPGPNTLLRRAGGELAEIGGDTQFLAIDW